MQRMGWKRGKDAWRCHEYKYQRRLYRCALAFMRQTAWVLRRMLPSLRPLSSRINTQLLRTSKPKPRPVLLGLGGLLQSVSRAYRAWLGLSRRLPVGCGWGPPVPKALPIL